MSRRPQFSRRDLDSDDEDGYSTDSSTSSLASISFEALSAAKKRIAQEDQEHSSDDQSEGEFFEPERTRDVARKKKSKHAPKEASSKKPVSKVREIPGLLEGTKYASSKHHDIRFDSAFGKVNDSEVRRNYKFLDDYREKELAEVQKVLKDKKSRTKLGDKEIQDLEYIAKSTKSRLDALKNRDMEKQVVKDYKKQTGYDFVKRSDKRKLVQVARFSNMKGRQREKVMERKRKKRFGKEMRQFEKNYNNDR